MKVFLSTKADRQLNKLPRSLHQLMLERIENLAVTPLPSGVKKLQGRAGWRQRVGDYRILYTIDNKKREIAVLSVAHRKEVYQEK